MVIFGFVPDYETISKIVEDVASYLKDKNDSNSLLSLNNSQSPKKTPKKEDKQR